MNLLSFFRTPLDLGKGTTPGRVVEVVRPEAARGLEQEVASQEHQPNQIPLSTFSTQEVYLLGLDAFLFGKQPGSIAIRPQDKRRLQTLDAFVRDVFSPDYVLDKVGPVSDWRALPDGESNVLAVIREGKEYLKTPDKDGVRNFFLAVYRAEVMGLGMQPPIVAHTKFRPDIVWTIRHDVFGGGLNLVKQFVRYGDGNNWENKAAEQLLFIHDLAQRYDVQLRQIAHQDFLGTMTAFRDQARRRANLLRVEAQRGTQEERERASRRADEIEQTYISAAENLQMPLPLHTLRLGPGRANWQ